MPPKRIIETVDNNYTITLYKGITYSRVFEYTDSDGVPINLTGKILKITFKNVFPQIVEIASNTGATPQGSTFTIIDAINGKFRLQLTDEETDTAETCGTWWIELISGSDIDLLWLDKVEIVEL